MKTKTPPLLKDILRAMALALSIAGVCTAQSTPPDLTQPGAIAAIKAKTDKPNYIYNYNLGPTGLRGWVYYYGPGSWTGQMTDPSRQILVTTASTPGSAVMAVDDVILGAVAASSGTVPAFTSDARKALGTAIANAEKTGAGTLRVKRWRAGATTDVNIAITTLGTYSATAPYSCPKSTLILANARDHMVGKLLADPDYLSTSLGHASAINALALLASVEPGHPNYAAVQTRMQTYARSLTVPANDAWTWGAAYELIFLSEYYLLTPDSQVVPVINGHTVRFAKGQGMFGTFGHGLGWLYPDGSGRMYIPPYGPVNACGNIANIAIVLGKKALQAAGQPIDPSIDAAIQRSSGFMGSHVNKGCMQYGEHFPHAGSYATNSKDASAAVFFGLQNDKAVQTEYFARMSISSWIGVELGHCGQGWGTLWGALGSGMGGDAAASGHFKQLLWRYDIHRRTDGSFTYDSDTQGNDYYGGKTADGTYLGESTDSDVKGTSLCLLTYSLPLKRLYITGKNLNTAYNHNLDATKVAHAVSAASFALDRTGKSIAQLFTDLGDYDPHLRHFASLELASRHMQNSVLTSTDLTNLRNLLNDTNPNFRGSAAQALGYLQDSTALPALVARLRDSDHWVRQKAANAIRYYANAAAVSVYRDAMLEAFIANGPADPDTIDWSDPLQFSNGQLGQLLFGSTSSDGAIFPRYSIPASTANAPKETHLYPALRIALLIPESLNRSSATNFVKTYLSAADAQALFPEVVDVISYTAPGDTMFSSGPREQALQFLTNNKIKEGIPLALSILDITGNLYNDIALDALASYGDAAHYTLPTLRRYRAEWPRVDGNGVPKTSIPKLLNAIQILENAVTAPPLIPGLCVANSQVVATTGAKAITLTGASPTGAFSFLNVTQPGNGNLTGTAPNLTYTPNAGFSGTDKFTFQTKDSIATSDPATVAIIVGTSGTGIVGTYFNNADFTSPVLTRTDPQINFDWGTGSPAGSIGNDTFSTRWGGYLLAPETGTYSLSSLTSDGVRAYLNGVPVINNLNDQSTRWTDGQSISLTAGQKVPLFLEYYENTGSAVAKLKWTGPSFAGLNGDIIPQAYLFANISDGGADTTAPMISTLFPADNAMQAARDTVLVATFNENILPGTGNITIENLSDGSQAVIPVTDSAHVTIFGATMVISPPTILSLGKNYAIRIANTAIQDASGNSFAGITNDTMWNFTTTDGMIISPQLITSNATSGISSTNTYTHAVNMGGGAVTINGVSFAAGGTTGTGYSTTNFMGATSGNFSEFPNPGDAVATMLDPFRYGNVGQTLTITGLTPGQMYDARIYYREWVTETNRSTLITFDADGAGPNSASTTVNGDATPQAFYLSYIFTATNEPLSVSFAGTSGNTGASFHLSGFSVQTSGPPELTTLNPADNATDVAADANLVATFTKPIAIGIGNITLKNLTDGINTPIAVTDTTQVSISGAVLTINPTANLLPTKNYAIQIAETAIDDTAGNSFAGITTDVTWNFTTVADTAPPVISTYSPADNATGVTIDANLVATFSEPIALGTGNITIKNLTDGIDTPIAVTDTTQVSISGSVLTINPTAFLLNGKNYAIQIAATAITDLANNSFGGINNDTTWNFTTPPSGTIIPPQLITSDATSGISSTNTYTHAVNMGGGGVVINGVSFSAGGETGTGYSTTEFAGVASGNFSEFPNPGDAVATMLDPFRFGNVGQTLTITGLTPGQTYDARIYYREWVGPFNRSTLVTFDEDGAGPLSTSVTVNQDATPQAFYLSYVFTATNAPLLVSFAGTAGNTGASFHLSGFSVQTAIPSGEPALTTLNPADNATGVAVDANLVATFNEPIIIGTDDITVKNLTDGTQTTIAVTDTTQVSVSGSVLTINPTANLLAGKNYAIQIAATAIKNLANNAFVGITDDTTWNFATLTSSSGSILFADNFDRANSTNLNASTSGKSGTLGALNWVQKVGSGGSSSISGNQLSGLGSTSGFSMSYIDHNFTDALISNGGGFSISIDLENYTTSGTVRHLGIAVGMSKAEAEGWAHNNPTSFTYADLFVGYRGNQSAIQVYDNGTRVINNTNAGAASTLPKTLKIDFALSGFNVGSTVNYTVTFGGVEMGTGSFAWTGTNENYIGVYSNLNGTGLFDDFAVSSMGGDSSPPEISSLSPTNNATGVAVGANLVATFSEVVAIATDNITIKNLTDATQTTIPVTDTTQVSISGAVLTINPAADLLPGKNYAVQIAATAIDDTAGNSFAGFTNNTSWNFTTAPDTTAPTPDPMSFATPPAALGQTSITMTATTATDPSGVEYFFECTAGGGHSSAWQDSPTYTDTGLTAATQYTYRVRARDKSAAQTATAWSAAASATTPNTPYGTWSGGAAFDGDANNDGVDNGMAWLLGAADPSENALNKLPAATRNGSNLRLTFRCLKSTMRGGVDLKVQTSSDMGLTDPWTSHEAAVPDADGTGNGVIFDTTDDGNYIHVIADIPAGGAKLFGRLSAAN